GDARAGSAEPGVRAEAIAARKDWDARCTGGVLRDPGGGERMQHHATRREHSAGDTGWNLHGADHGEAGGKRGHHAESGNHLWEREPDVVAVHDAGDDPVDIVCSVNERRERCVRARARLKTSSFSFQLAVCSCQLRRGEAEGFGDGGVDGGVAGSAGDETEVAAPVPHGPADVVGFEAGADGCDVAGAGGGRGGVAVGAEFVAEDRDVVFAAPAGGEGDALTDRVWRPVAGGVEEELVAGDVVGDGFERGVELIDCGREGDVLVVEPLRAAPGGALMGELVGLVIVKGIDDVFGGKWLSYEEIVEGIVVRS